MPGKQKRRRDIAIDQQGNVCFFCWQPMLPSYLDEPDSAALVNLDPPGAPWPRYMTWPRHVAAHARCAAEINDMRQPSTGYTVTT